MERLYKRWDEPKCLFGDLAVLGFFIVQGLDGMLTYLGVSMWGTSIEGNPLISSIVAAAGPAAGLAGAKLMAISFGMVLHLRRVHNIVAFLTAVYVAFAILPWTALFLAN